jgi:hypothetical protein
MENKIVSRVSKKAVNDRLTDEDQQPLARPSHTIQTTPH